MSSHYVAGPLPPAPGDAGGDPPTMSVPDWVPGVFSPEAAVIAGAVLALLVLLLFLVWVVRRLRKGEGATADSSSDQDPWVRRLIGAILISVPLLLALTFYGSFHAVEKFAEKAHVDPAWIPPVAIDGTLVVFLLFDLLFARLGRPNEFVKQTTRGFIALTLVANAAAGWGSMAAVFLHIPAPLAIVVLTEVSRQALVAEARKKDGMEPFDAIPFMRWVLAPRATFGLWRWMILRDVRSYSTALATDTVRRDALAIVDSSPAGTIPGYLARRLREGMDVSATAARVRALAGVDDEPFVPTPSTPTADGSTPPSPVEVRSGVEAPVSATLSATPDAPGGVEPASGGVDAGVETSDGSPVVQGPSHGVPVPDPTPSEGVGVERVETPPVPVAESGGVQSDPPGSGLVLHSDTADEPVPTTDAGVDVSERGVSETVGVRPPATTEGEGDEDGPEDDGPRGGGAPTPPAPAVVPGQMSVADVLPPLDSMAPVRPDPLETARIALDGPVWDEVADDTRAKKPRIMALLWECAGDVTAARAAWTDRTEGEEFPPDTYRSGRGYAHQWHKALTAYLIERHGHVDEVRALLSGAGVDHTHEGVDAALAEWESAHGHQVIQFRRPTPTGL
uniref:PNPL.11c n=2 Tax=Nocardiopsis sp. 25L-1-1c TaxID=1009683 RepID=R4HCV4_9ACTN|nr:pNPL.11c [Nocardiopsis sp. 25L-1-1c]